MSAVVAFWWLGERELIEGPPYWVFLIMILGSIACDAAVRIWSGRRPGSRGREQVRIVVAVSATTVILYATGWGSLLGIAYALCAVQVLAQLRTVDWRLVLGWCVVGVTAAEFAVDAGVAPSVVSI